MPRSRSPRPSRLASAGLALLLLAACADAPAPGEGAYDHTSPSVPPTERVAASASVDTLSVDTLHATEEAAPAPADGAPDTEATVRPDPDPQEANRLDPARTDSLPEGLVYLREVAPTIVEEMRYATPFNFTGGVVEGYEAGRCILSEPAARALAAVQDDLAERGLGLKVYDCYRPQRAVDHFVRWSRTSERSMKPVFYPDVIKGRLFADGYIASRSGHSRASTVDLTIVPLPPAPQPPYPSPDAAPPCTAPAGERYADNGLDMGTAYDCFSPRSHTDNPAVGEAALANRHLLRTVMGRHGLRNYSKEWWHYTLRDEPFPDTYFDVPVR